MSVAFNHGISSSLMQTIGFLCERGNFGYAVFDNTYRATWRYGALADWIPLGVDICNQTDLFFGLQKELLDLQDEHGSCVTLPRVGIPGFDEKISIEVYWDEQAEIYHTVIHRLVAESEVELELLKQIRARRLAEENFQITGEALARKQMLLDVIMDNLPISTAIFDDQQRFLFVTRHWCRDFRIECEPLLGQRFFDACPNLSDSEKQRFQKSMAGLSTAPSLAALPRSSGAPLDRLWTHTPWWHSQGDQGGVMTTLEDVSALEGRSRALERANQQLRAANQQLAHFASILSHDLSAPMRSLTAAVERHSQPGSAADDNFRADVEAHLARMKSIFSSMSEYMHVLCFEPVTKVVDMRQLVGEILKSLPGNEKFEVSLPTEASELWGNPGILDLVLRNLIENAIKHHDLGEGHIKIALAEIEDVWLISVTDDGPGISMAQQNRLMQGRFDKARLGAAEKGGKGLPIVVRALSGIGATLEIVSDPSRARGTTFQIRWPKEPDQP